jgi:hypothetical protein
MNSDQLLCDMDSSTQLIIQRLLLASYSRAFAVYTWAYIAGIFNPYIRLLADIFLRQMLFLDSH